MYFEKQKKITFKPGESEEEVINKMRENKIEFYFIFTSSFSSTYIS
jgi:hypothetical protein